MQHLWDDSAHNPLAAPFHPLTTTNRSFRTSLSDNESDMDDDDETWSNPSYPSTPSSTSPGHPAKMAAAMALSQMSTGPPPQTRHEDANAVAKAIAMPVPPPVTALSVSTSNAASSSSSSSSSPQTVVAAPSDRDTYGPVRRTRQRPVERKRQSPSTFEGVPCPFGCSNVCKDSPFFTSLGRLWQHLDASHGIVYQDVGSPHYKMIEQTIAKAIEDYNFAYPGDSTSYCDERTLTCKFPGCGSKYSSVLRLRRHFKRTHAGFATCFAKTRTHCRQGYRSYDELKAHMASAHNFVQPQAPQPMQPPVARPAMLQPLRRPAASIPARTAPATSAVLMVAADSTQDPQLAPGPAPSPAPVFVPASEPVPFQEEDAESGLAAMLAPHPDPEPFALTADDLRDLGDVPPIGRLNTVDPFYQDSVLPFVSMVQELVDATAVGYQFHA